MKRRWLVVLARAAGLGAGSVNHGARKVRVSNLVEALITWSLR